MRISLLFASALFLAGPATAQEQAAPESVGRIFGNVFAAILQGDGPQAIVALEAISSQHQRDIELRQCITERLSNTLPADNALNDAGGDEFVADVLRAYRSYWSKAIMVPAESEAARNRLFARLTQLVKADEGNPGELDERGRAMLSERGLEALIGRTGILMDIFAWRTDRTENEIVVLPTGLQSTKVHYLNDFASMGWSNYMSCGYSGTGGWATPKGIYVITPTYDSLTDEKFRISYLIHESQHFSDYERFPGLKGWELEYRAKLAELINLVETRNDVITRFEGNRSDNPDDAHSYANGVVIAALRERLGLTKTEPLTATSIATLQSAARLELWEDTRRHEEARAETPTDHS